MSSAPPICTLLQADVWFDLEPQYWSERQQRFDSLADFCARSPCMEWIVYIVAVYRIDLALAILRMVLFDTWSRLQCTRTLAAGLAERVHVLQLGPSILPAGALDFDPPLTETWMLVGEEELDAEWELAQCIGALADFSTDVDLFDPEHERALGIFVGLRRIWSEFVQPPAGWEADYVAPEDRKIDSDSAYADSFLLRRYQGVIARLVAQHRC